MNINDSKQQFTAILTDEAEEQLIELSAENREKILMTTQKAPQRFMKQARRNIEKYLKEQETTDGKNS